MTYIPQRRKEDRPAGRFFRFMRRFFFFVGVSVTISAFFLALSLSQLIENAQPPLPDNMLLTYTFNSDVSESGTAPSLDRSLLRPATTLREIVAALYAAAKDDRVKGFVARLEDADFSLAQVQELRAAVAAFRMSGKPAAIYSDSFGGLASGMGDYYLAAAFGEVWLQPVGVVAASGIAMEVPFFKGAFDKLGIATDFAHRGTYKSAPESLTEAGMTAPHREMMESLVTDVSSQMISGIAADRGLAPEKLKELVNAAPFSDKAALREKLVDRLGYYDEALAEAGKKAGDQEVATVSLLRYSAALRKSDKTASKFVSKFGSREKDKEGHKSGDKKKAHPKIALIYGTGEIVPYGGKSPSGFGESGMAADKIVEAFQSAQEDGDVAAIVFRVDSPGGAPTAAESIRRALMQARAKGKPVVVSMSGTAASGAYWVAAAADKIIAQPATLTGSIGVFGGKFVLAGLWEKLGVNWEGVSSGDRARMWSSHKAFTPEEKQKFDAMLGDIYEAFLERVMEGRNMTRAQVEAVAEGRVWTGRQAQANGLVDELGGLDRAIEVAKAQAKLELAQDIPVVDFPPRKTPLELFLSLATEGALFRPTFTFSLEDIGTQLPFLRTEALTLAVRPLGF